MGCFFVAPRLLGRELPKKARRSELDSFGECCAPKGRRVGTISLRRERNIHIYIYIYTYITDIYIYIYRNIHFAQFTQFTRTLRIFYALFEHFLRTLRILPSLGTLCTVRTRCAPYYVHCTHMFPDSDVLFPDSDVLFPDSDVPVP